MENKHGIIVKEFKAYNHKCVYNNGHLMMKYTRIPKDIEFTSPMVNDINQVLCHGWFPDWIRDWRKETFQRVLDGLKPMGIFTVQTEGDANAIWKQVNRKRFFLEIQGRPWDGCWYVCVAAKGTIRQNFDLEALKRDYLRHVGKAVANEITGRADCQIWTLQHSIAEPGRLPAWLHGLVLGYPVENAISLYLEGRAPMPTSEELDSYVVG